VSGALLACVCSCLLLLGVGRAIADPLPGFDFDPEELRARMDACISYQVGEREILMGWVNIRTGDSRHWRCSSLRHMLFDVDDRPAHDPYVNVADFMRCADKAVSGFPDQRRRDGENLRYIYQYNGTANQAIAVVNTATGDIVTIYTTLNNDWTGCANGL
jgi:hypothetical protein